MPYRLFIPVGYDARRSYPLVVWLHGAGGAGSDNVRQISGDQTAGTQLWTSPTVQAAHPAFVVAPQSAASSPYHATLDLWPDLHPVVVILDRLEAEFSIDRRRIYVLGQSIGANGVWNLITNLPDRFAAAVLVCPQPQGTTRVSSVAKMPLSIVQGGADPWAPRSRELVEALEQAGGRPRYTEYPGAGHDIWTRVFAEPDIVEWVFAQSR
jgi:predicted peptidase